MNLKYQATVSIHKIQEVKEPSKFLSACCYIHLIT